MPESKIFDQCFLCGSKFQMGPHRYDGKFIQRYGVLVCIICYNANEDGWANHHEQRLVAHLKDKAIPVPIANDRGLLPRD